MAERLTAEQVYDKFLISDGISIDSRTTTMNDFFIAIHGDRFNGNSFADKALENGAIYAVVDEEEYATTEQHLLVEDSLQTLQAIATLHRETLSIPVIGLTGSNGKTTTKELMHSVLSTTYRCFATKGNLNNHIGVPISILSISPECEIAVIEMGANHLGEIASLCKIAQPTCGLITNIGKAHLEGFGSEENVAKGKSELFDYLRNTDNKTAFVNSDDQRIIDLSTGLERIEYGEHGQFLKGTIVDDNPKLMVHIDDGEQSMTITTHLVGDYNLHNILAAACVGRYFNCEFMDVMEGIEEYEPKNMRSQEVNYKGNLYIVDAYNANPTSMNASLKHFIRREHPNKMAVLGSMLELGTYAPEEHEKIAKLVSQENIPTLLVGNEFKKSANEFQIPWVENVDTAREWIKNQNLKDAMILLKGSRGIQLEKLISDLEK